MLSFGASLSMDKGGPRARVPSASDTRYAAALVMQYGSEPEAKWRGDEKTFFLKEKTFSYPLSQRHGAQNLAVPDPALLLLLVKLTVFRKYCKRCWSERVATGSPTGARPDFFAACTSAAGKYRSTLLLKDSSCMCCLVLRGSSSQLPRTSMGLLTSLGSAQLELLANIFPKHPQNDIVRVGRQLQPSPELVVDGVVGDASYGVATVYMV